MSSTSVCPTITCCGGQSPPPARLHPLLSRTVEPGGVWTLDLDDFWAMLSSSRLCQPNDWPNDVDEMAAVYDVELTRLLDQLTLWLIMPPGTQRQCH